MRRLSLSLKLTLALALAVLLGVAIVAAGLALAAGAGLSDYVSHGAAAQMQALAPQLEAHYARQGSWAGAQALLTTSGMMGGDDAGGDDAGVMGHGRGMGQGMMGAMGAMMGARLIVADADGLVVADAAVAGNLQGERLGRSALVRSLELRVAGRRVGYVVPREGAAEAEFRASVTRAIALAGVAAALLAIGLGWWLTRRALQPLNTLATAAGQIGAGDLAYRVPVQARDEVGRLAARFNAMAAALERDEQLRRQMVDDIAHELRTPLTVMQGHLEALQDGVFALDVDALRPIYDETLLLTRLVGDLRDLATAEAGRLPLELAPLDPAALLARAEREFHSEAEAAGVALTVQAPAGLPRIHGDAQRLGQVLANLLSNALRYTPRGGRVTLSAAVEGPWVRLDVADTGAGIAPEDLPLVFERFYRADRARRRDAHHSGLGLAIARQLVEAHGGTLTAASTLGQGSVFSVRLPASP